MPSCYIVGCKSGYGGSKGTHVFRIPAKATESTRQLWKSNIPKRQDREFDFKTCYVCHLHFEEQFIVKKTVISAELNIIVDRKRWTLTPDAVPSIFVNSMLPSYLSRCSKGRKPPNGRSTELKEETPPRKETCSVKAVQQMRKDCKTVEPPTSFNVLLDGNHIELPAQWTVSQNENSLTYSKLARMDATNIETYFIERSVTINQDLNVSVKLRGLDTITHLPNVDSAGSLMECILIVDSLQLCSGAGEFSILKLFPNAFKCNNTWISTQCKGTSISNVCCACAVLRNEMRKCADNIVAQKRYAQMKARKATKTTPTKSRVETLKKRTNLTARKLKRLEKKNNKLREEHKALIKKFRKADISVLHDAIDNSDFLTPQFKSTIKNAVSVQKAKGKSGRRYSADWILQAILLKIQSPKAYRHLRSEGILPLPNPSYLTRLLSGFKCQFGFSDFVLKWLRNEFQCKPRRDRQVFLVFDEMKVKESISFDKASMQFTGFVDYENFEVTTKKAAKKEADHALVFMVRSLNSKLTQPIASFATRGAAPGHVLAKMIVNAIMKLEEIGLEVVGVVSDGATTNKSAWKFLGIQCGSVTVNKISNPFDSSRDVYFLCDVPHIFKCIRNHMLKHRECLFNNNVVHWGYYEQLYKTDSTSELRVVPKLTLQHVHPNPFQKMTVSLAVQVYSKSMADGLKFYRDVLENPHFKDSGSTESFTRIMNELFDACNARIPKEGLSPLSAGYQTIKKFLQTLSETDNFASDTTLTSLRITLQSILDLVDYLCSVVGFAYVLTAKFNQDCLEKFFGLVRSFGGDDSHPTLTSFGHLFRLLSVYTPCARVIRGNVRSAEEVHVERISYLEMLKSLKCARSKESTERKKDLENAILGKILYEDNAGVDIGPARSGIQPASSFVMFHLAGYIAFKGKSFTKCLPCQKTLSDSNYCPPEASLTEIKNLGGLKMPSQALHVLISSVLEPAIAKVDQLEMIHKNFIFKFIENIPEFPNLDIGCDEHAKSLIVEIILYYITIRMYFYTKNYNRESLSSMVKAKQKFKEGKLK